MARLIKKVEQSKPAPEPIINKPIEIPKESEEKIDIEALREKIVKDKKIRMELVRKNHFMFFQIYFSEHATYPTAPFQMEMFQLTEDTKIQTKVICSFRGSGKTTIITLSFPIWAILGVLQKKYILILAQTIEQAKRILKNIKEELESNDLLRKDLGPFYEEGEDWNSLSLVFSRQKARITIASVDTSIRGTKHGSHRPDLVILDDVEDINSTRTKEGRTKIFEWVTGDVLPIGDKNTIFFFVGNLLHSDSLLMRLKAKFENYPESGIYREYPFLDENGDPLWPGKFMTAEDVEKEKSKILSESSWQREYLLKIIGTDEQIIKPEWIQYYDEYPKYNRPEKTAMGVDLATGTENGDYTAMVAGHLFGRGAKAIVYIVPEPVNKRLSLKENITYAKEYSRQIKFPDGYRSKIIIEDVAFQKYIYEDLKLEHYEAELRKPGGSDKATRLQSVTHMVQSGNVLFPKTGCEELIEQLLGFPRESHDDLVDAFSILLSWMSEHRTGAVAICYQTDHSDLNHLSSREKQQIIEERERINDSIQNAFGIC